MAMRGLNTFITDLRNCRTREQEVQRVNKELANIRTKFKDPNLNGYQKKKYVCKLAFMYILGYDINCGHLEAVNLVTSNIYSEKSLGYMAVTLLVADNDEFIRLIIKTIRNDLQNSNELSCSLALQAIANIANKDMADSLTLDIFPLLTSPSSFVRKKAALCLLCLFRKYPDVFPLIDWSSKVVTALNDKNMGVVLSVCPLIISFSEAMPDVFISATNIAINQLHNLAVDNACPEDYLYYKLPAPWVQIKLFQLLQIYAPILTESQRVKLNTILEHSLTAPAETLKNPQQANAKLAIIFEAVKLALAVDSESSHVQKAIMILKPFLSAKETNFRYIGLDVLTYFVSYPETRPYLQMDLQSVVQTLRDKDVSVQRRSLYLLFCLADSSNGEYIVRELMDFFNTANFEIHDELVLKIAILAEKFATDYGWFLQVILDLINIAGEHVGDEVWFRIVYIVTNNEDIRAFAAGRVLRSLWNPICNEKTLKLSGYILGEYGHLISNEPGASPLEQFMALHAKFRSASTPTRCLLLSVYLKLVNVFPEIKAEVMRVFKQYIHALDTELQQRACEYLAILEMDTDDVLQAVCEEMPPFAERANILVSQLEHKYQEVSHKRALDFLDQGKKEPNAEKNLQASGSPQDYAIPRKQSVNLLSFEDDANSQDDSAAIHTAVLYKKLILENTGVFYEDSAIQIGLKMEFRNTSGKLAIFVGNKTDSSLVNVSCVVISSESYQFKLVEQLAPVVPSMTQLHQLTDIECLTVALETPILHFGFQKAGAVLKKLELSLPIHMARFMVPVELSRSNFDDRWQQIGGPPRECQIQMRTDNLVSSDSLKKMMKQLNMQVLEDVEDTCWAAGIFCSSTLGKVGCLVRIDRMEMGCQITVRTTNEHCSLSLSRVLESSLRA